MRDLTRSVASLTWALSLFGVEQMVNLASPRRYGRFKDRLQGAGLPPG
jgi:hypothetical protein